LMNKDD